ncbi:MAG: 2OG-Fe(II) oxygenase [Congregibacter sp.]|nr:2OG-Fe(II) oxygenase [Congregibacter sp.]
MPVSEEWMEWTRSQLKNGATIAEVRETLKANGFGARDIKYAFKHAVHKTVYKRTLQTIVAVEKHRELDPGDSYQILAHPKLVRNCDGRTIVSLCETPLQLYTVPNFLSAEQCDTLIDIISSNAHPSRVDGYQAQTDLRSSRTCALSVHDHPYVADINAHISRTLGLSLKWSEVTQGQWYQPGEQYKPHPDYFTPGTPEYTRFVAAQGQRTWTFMIYLNKTERGGGTHFTKINKTVMPEQGRAVCWNNLHEDGLPNLDSEHAGLPVIEGSKFIITKWFRGHGQGPPLVY